MSDERFELDGTGIFDNKTNKFYYKTFDNEEIVDLLNKQQATIIKQDEEIRKLKRTERSWRKIHCCNKESDNCGIIIEQQSTIKLLQGRVKRLNAFIVSKDLAIEYLKWNTEKVIMMSEKRFTDIWCSETGHIGVIDCGIDKEFTSDEFKDFLNELNDENEQLRQKVAWFEKQEDEFEEATAQTIQNMIANYRDDDV